MRVRRLLEAQGVQVLLTRSSDVYMDITPRMQSALDAHADLFVSIHLNGYADPAAAGSLVLYPKDFCQPFAARLAQAMARRLAPYGVLPDGLQYRPEMFQAAAMPTGTIEPLYLTNPDEAALMTRDEVRDAIAGSVVDAVDEQAGPEIAERRALAAAWTAVSPLFAPAARSAGNAGRGVAAATPSPSLLPGSAGVQPDGIIPLATPGASGAASPAASATPAPAGAAAGSAAPSPAAGGGGGGALHVATTPSPSPPWLWIAIAMCALALVAGFRRARPAVVVRRAVLHGLAVASAATLRTGARLSGAEMPSIPRFDSRSKRRIARRRALLERSRSRGDGYGAGGTTRAPAYQELFFRPAPSNRASAGAARRSRGRRSA